MKNTKYIWTGIGLIIIATSLFAAKTFMEVTSPVAPTTPPVFSWSVIEGDVVLTADGKKYPLGHYDGNCTTMASSSWKLLNGELTGVICYFAGGGQELGIFKEDGLYLVKVGELSEPTEESPGVRGNFRVLRKIP